MELLAAGQELAERGHDVYIIIADKNIEGSFLKHLPITIMPLKYRLTESIPSGPEIERQWMEAFYAGTYSRAFTIASLTVCEAALNDNVLIDKLRSLNIDMALVSLFPHQLLIPRLLNIPYAVIGCIYEPYLGGAPTLPIFPSSVQLNYNDRMSFWQRLKNFVVTTMKVDMKTILLWDYDRNLIPNFYQRNSPGISPAQLVSESQLFFITRDHLLEWPLPAMPNVIQLPSLLYHPSKPLSDEFNELASSSTKGMIIVSFGTFTHHLSDECVNKFLHVFRLLEQTVIWKMAALTAETSSSNGVHDSLLKASPNIRIYSRIPQNDLLGHKNTRLFITHSGNNGQYEAVYHGVPMVSLFFFLDQSHNAFRMVDHGFGVALDIKIFTSEQLLQAVGEVLSNDTYRQNIKKASAILHDYPMTGRKSVAHWMEHAIKFGSSHLRSPGADMVWYEYFMVDIVLTSCAGLVIILCVIKATLRMVNSCVRWIFLNKILCSVVMKSKTL